MMPAAMLLAGALVVSAPSPATRLGGAASPRVRPAAIPASVAAVALAAFAFDRASVVIAGSAAAATAVHTVARRRRARAATARAAAAAEFTGHLADALGAGATPADAASRAAAHLPASAPPALRRDVVQFTAAAQRGVAPQQLATPELQRVAALWAISISRGVPVARLFGLARDEIDHALRHRAATQAALAGPRTTAAVLALLPLAGIAMGAAMGAHPLQLLFSPGIGGALLVGGTALVCAGVVASGEIIGRAAA